VSMTLALEIDETTPVDPLTIADFDEAVKLIPSGTELPCHQVNPDLWFAESPADVETAKTLCAPCPLKTACLAGALERREPWGVWGGQAATRPPAQGRCPLPGRQRGVGSVTASFTPLVNYLIRRLKMYTALAEQLMHVTAHERQLQAEAEARARRLLTVRRWQRKAEKANHRVRLARLAVR
jgi:WhiB family redox-sensing transcriptional regulator